MGDANNYGNSNHWTNRKGETEMAKPEEPKEQTIYDHLAESIGNLLNESYSVLAQAQELTELIFGEGFEPCEKINEPHVAGAIPGAIDVVAEATENISDARTLLRKLCTAPRKEV